MAEIDGNPCVAMSYDYTVLAGTQGMRGHLKKDRLFEIAERRRLPVVLFAEGGGGRPGDVDFPIVAGLDCRAFHLFGRLSGLVPLVGIASGYCFAGNAALLGCCDVVIATEDSSIGMGGPAMIEGGGLGVYEPAEVGPIDVQHANGVVDLRVADDQAAVAAAKRYLSYFHGPVEQFTAPDQRLLREIVPEQRKRAYEVRKVLHGLCDEDSVLELRDGFGAGMVTALARIEGKPLGVVANDPSHLGGAIDADAADKAARFLQMCDAFGLPVLFLCDTPGFMVGPDGRADGDRAPLLAPVRDRRQPGDPVRHDRAAQGLRARRPGDGRRLVQGAIVHASAGRRRSSGGWAWRGPCASACVASSTRSRIREERERVFQATVAAAYAHGEGLNMAAYGEIDDVIDPGRLAPLDRDTVRSAGRRLA